MHVQDPIRNAPLVYALGHSRRELERLAIQARLIDPITRRFFHAAGIVPGMRVLDVGSGAGDVAILLADMVGPSGEVVGVDRSEQAVAAAQAKVVGMGLGHVSFQTGDLFDYISERPFDAIAGRYVLMFNADPALGLARLARQLRPGGCIVFHEPDWEHIGSAPAAPSYDRCCHWIIRMFQMVGTDVAMGRHLFRTFRAAGLPAPGMALEAVIGGVPVAADALLLIANLTEVLLPTMERLGIATAGEVGLADLLERMTAEVEGGGGIVFGRSEVGAWATV